MKTIFTGFSRLDWVSFSSCIALVILTLIPIFWDIDTGGGWLRTSLISLGSIILSIIVVAQIRARELDETLTGEVKKLQTLVDSAVALDAVHEVPAGHIRQVLDEMLESSKEWYFRGGSARWQRQSVLPTLAKENNRPIPYKAQIISPFQIELCEKYAQYRSQSRPNERHVDSKQIRLELLAFIYATAVWGARSKISAHVTLLNRFSPLRLDGNSQSFLITVADTQRNGLRANADNWYYAAILDEFEFESQYATGLNLPKNASDAVGVESLNDFFNELEKINPGLPCGWRAGYSDEDWGQIFVLANTKA